MSGSSDEVDLSLCDKQIKQTNSPAISETFIQCSRGDEDQ